MNDEKQTGSYYTPHDVISFMVDYLKTENQDFSKVLEPSAGDGRFLSLLQKESKNIVALEIIKEKVKQMKKDYSGDEIKIVQADFLKYALKKKEKYSLIIGNPPYINPKLMDKESIEKAREICKAEGIPTTVMQNMWLAFVIGACRLLESNGTIFFVLPMEFLQVQYAEKLRAYLETKFNTIHIISFQKFVFADIEQEVCLVYLTNKNQQPCILYKIYEDAEQRNTLLLNTIKKNKPLQKWSNAILSDEDIQLLKEKSSQYKKVEEIGITAPGIVTGGNKCFILEEEKVRTYDCEKYVIPILQKSSFIEERTITIDKGVMERIRTKNKPMYLLDLADIKEEQLPEKLKDYLEKEGEKKVRDTDIPLKKRFKCANRKPWYGVPIVKKGEVIFFKRYDILPRIYINEIDVHTTDAGYHIRLNAGYDKESLVFCFYNSLTLAQCEYHGRYYGGGVRELVPSEFKRVTIPYREIDKKDIEQLESMFQEKVPSEQIIQFVNSKTIELEMQRAQVKRVESIWRKLVQRRTEIGNDE